MKLIPSLLGSLHTFDARKRLRVSGRDSIPLTGGLSKLDLLVTPISNGDPLRLLLILKNKLVIHVRHRYGS